MSAIAQSLGPVFLLISLGVLLRRLEFPGDHFWPQVERLTYYILFPCMLVFRLATAQHADPSWGALIYAITAIFLTGAVFTYLLRRWIAVSAAAFTSVFQGSLRFNTYIGIAVADALYGDAGVVAAAISLAVMIPLVNILSVLAFHLTLHRSRPQVWPLLKTLASNPLILGCLAGLALNHSNIGLPGWSQDTVRLLGGAALPLGLLAVGVGLQIDAFGGQRRELLSASLMRFLAMPLLTLVALKIFSLPTLSGQVLILFATLPTATSAYILARQLGGDNVLMANIITLQTLLGFGVMPLWLLAATNLT